MTRLSLLVMFAALGACEEKLNVKKGRGPLAGQSPSPADEAGEAGEAAAADDAPAPGSEPARAPTQAPRTRPISCPPGAEQHGNPPPLGKEAYCAKDVDGRRVKHGPYRLWAGDILIRSGTFDLDQKDGNWTEWYDDGTKKSFGQHQDGAHHGRWQTWFENGELSGEGSHDAGKKSGRARFFYESGKIKAESTYVDDLRVGRSVNYFESGEMQSVGNYLAGKKTGSWRDFTESGVVTESTYEGGVKTSR